MAHTFAGGTGNVSYTFTYSPASQIATRTRTNDVYASTTALNVDRDYSVNGLNQYGAAGSTTFAYDANGNLTRSGTTTYTYDIENRLVGASGGRVLRYDPLGRLYEATGASGTRRFIWDGDAMAVEYTTAGAVAATFVHGSSAGDDPLLWRGGGEDRRIRTDHQGSVIAITNDAGTANWINGYDAWGIPNANNGGRFQYTGQIWLGDFGLYHYKGRIYSPTLGRFLQTDPVAYDGGINLYAYVGNDPLNLVDMTGRRPGDPFLNAQDARVDYFNYHNRNSIRRNTEFHGAIYQRHGRYYATPGVETGREGGRATITLQGGDIHVEDVHTHGNYSEWGRNGWRATSRFQDELDSDNFSTYDIGRAESTGRPMSIGTPSGVYKTYDPATDETEIINPYEPRSVPPERRQSMNNPTPRAAPPLTGTSCNGRQAGSCGSGLEIWN